MSIKTGKELAAACLNIAKNYKTLYVLGCFGWPMNDYNKQRSKNEYEYNRNRAEKIDAASADTFGFDCVNLIKALLWGWVGDVNAPYGGAVYASNGVPDIDESVMINACIDVSTDFSSIQVGEAVWIPGHIGVYIGDGLAVESTPAWKDGVQITAVHNLGTQSGYNGRTWTKHGKLPYVAYESSNKLSEGDIVTFTGNTHYASSNAPGGLTCPSGEARVTAIAEGAKHPYHLVKTGNEGPWGWVNAGDIAELNKPVQPEPAVDKFEITLSVLRKGATGETVRALQLLLIGNGFDLSPFGADGDFGEITESAVGGYQSRQGLEVDGVVGPATWAKLLGM